MWIKRKYEAAKEWYHKDDNFLRRVRFPGTKLSLLEVVTDFFTKDGPTTLPVNYYQLDLKGVSLGKTRPLRETDLAEFEALVKKSGFPADGELKASECPSHWQVDPKSVDDETVDLTVKNPNVEEVKLPSAAECRAEIKAALAEIAAVIEGW